MSATIRSRPDLPGLIQSVYASLAALGQAPEPVEEKLTPAVSVRASVKPDAVTCLDCGEKMKMLKRHLGTEHGMTPAEYRARWNLPADYPMVAPDYAAKRKELAVGSALAASRRPLCRRHRRRHPRPPSRARNSVWRSDRRIPPDPIASKILI
jgi:predicted transcriptional regulator